MRKWQLILAIALTGSGLSGPQTATAQALSTQALPGGFVYLREIDTGIIQDIRYAGSNNFVGRPLAGYAAGECVVMANGSTPGVLDRILACVAPAVDGASRLPATGLVLARTDEPGQRNSRGTWWPRPTTWQWCGSTATYATPPATYSNLWLVRLDDAGRCTEFHGAPRISSTPLESRRHTARNLSAIACPPKMPWL